MFHISIVDKVRLVGKLASVFVVYIYIYIFFFFFLFLLLDDMTMHKTQLTSRTFGLTRKTKQCGRSWFDKHKQRSFFTL